MAKKPATRKKTTKAAAPERTEPATPADVREVISEKKLRALLASARSAAKDVASINGTIREKIGYAKEHDHLHTGAFAVVRKADKLEPEKLADFLDSLDHYLDISGLRDRAATVQRMDFGPGKGEAEDEAGETPSNVQTLRPPASVAAE